MKSYNTLDQLVLRLIQQYSAGKKENSSMSSQYSSDLLPYSSSRNVSSDETNEIITNLVNSLNRLVEPRISKGLEVTASNPPDEFINVSSGAGVVWGQYLTCNQNLSLRVPLDGKTPVFYVNFDGGSMTIEPQRHESKIPIAKIVIPKPGITVAIEDDQPLNTNENLNGWIVSGKDVLFDGKWTFDDDSLAILGNKLDYILARNIYGELTLNENLKIKNTQGTLLADSKSLQLFYENNVKASEFNRHGVFFYDTNGFELAKFTSSEARVGNIIIYPNSIQSGNFVSGNLGSGFQIKDDGDAEFNNVKVRGKISSSVFEKNAVSSIGGNFLINDSDILDEDMTSLDSSTLTITGDTVFALNDILRIKDGDDDEWLIITDITSAPTYIVTRDNAEVYTSNNNPAWKKGTAVVNYGANGEGLIFMTASESNAPYISILSHSGSPWSSTTTQLRLGNLNGFLGYSTNKYGIAIGTNNSYLKYDDLNGLQVKGNITITSSNWSHPNDATKIDGGDIYTGSVTADKITTDDLAAINANLGSITAGNMTLNTTGYIKGGQSDWTSGTGFFLGYKTDAYKFSIGNSTNELRWDGSALNLKGEINATSGEFSGNVNIGSTNNVIIDGENQCIKIFADTVTIETDVNDDLDWVEDTTTGAAILSANDYTPSDLATEVQSKMRAVGDVDTTVTYNSSTKKLTIANSTLTTLTLQFYSGNNNSTTCGQALGFDVSANKSGALSYTSDEEVCLRVKMGLL